MCARSPVQPTSQSIVQSQRTLAVVARGRKRKKPRMPGRSQLVQLQCLEGGKRQKISSLARAGASC